MSTAKPPYDPVKTVEAMFMGSVARIAYVLKDPVNYAPATKAVLAETAKKFQDALDDCEIRILDAKWYLERQLALNRARREAKAREDSAASAKRKRDEVHDAQDKAQTVDGESAPKRVKTQEPEEPQPEPPKAQPKPQQLSPAQKPPPLPTPAASKSPLQPSPTVKDKPAPAKPPEKPQVPTPADVTATPPAPTAPQPQEKPKPPEPVLPPERTNTQTTTDDFSRQILQDTPADNNDGFTFESMFGEPSAEMIDGAGNDMTFDLDDLSGDSYGGDATNVNLQDNSLNSLLPGLESYANQAGDDTAFTIPSATANGLAPVPDPSALIPTTEQQQSQQQNPDNINDFDLPALGGPNEFDDFLNANDMGFDESNNFDGNTMLNMDGMDGMDNMDNMDNMESMDNLDFDSMFS